ncbi:MAG TPA: 30S ribosomal protein S7 [Dehalococcoidales bacterium]|jgi:small subunit ribosomal protein S7|nr:30S ribosomal protein S7 [Dehalococcoidales bacterium]
MARRARMIKRNEVMPDAKYQSLTVSKLMNRIMKRGKKSRAEEIVYGAMDLMGKQGSKDPVTDMESAIRNITPQLKVKSRRVGGATYQVPVEVPPQVGMSLALRWLVDAARARSGKSMAEKLAAEMSDAAKGQGNAAKKREDTHKMADANRAFAHYRW